MYTYKAKLSRVIDGDTAIFIVYLTRPIDYGFYLYEDTPTKTMNLTFRLLSIDCPERRYDYPGWLAAKEHLIYLLGDGEVTLESLKAPGSFQRWLCTIWKDGININQKMIEDGHAVEYKK